MPKMMLIHFFVCCLVLLCLLKADLLSGTFPKSLLLCVVIRTSAESSTEGLFFFWRGREEWRFGSVGCGCGSGGLNGSPNWFQNWLLLAAVLSICGTGIRLLLHCFSKAGKSEQKWEELEVFNFELVIVGIAVIFF